MERSQVTSRNTIRDRAGRFVSLALLVLLCASCTTPRRSWSEADDPGELRAVENFATEGLWRQHINVGWDGSDPHGFDAVLQRRGSALTVLGLSSTGSTGFAFVLSDGEIEVTNHTGDELPIPPRFILLDVQRSFYPWLPASNAFGIDGRYEGEVGGEYVTEIRKDGRLHERVFRRLEGDPGGEIRVRYTWGRDGWSVPSVVELENGWFGYRLRIETHDETLLRESVP